MDFQSEDLKSQVDSMEKRLSHLETANQQLAQLLAGLAQVTQQLMEANSVVLDVAKKLKDKKK